MSEGRIRKALSGFYYVDTGSEVLTCRARGKFRKEGISPLVGDRVEVRELGNGEGFVEAILPRKNAFSRPAVANIDQLVIVASQAIPVTDPFLIDRVIAIAEGNHCESIVCINKCDLASGGELARIMLALKNVLAEQESIGTLVFDEVDTGVSGRAAQKVAEKLAQVSRRKQVLCVTHLPQLAAMADTHFSVEKGERDGRTYTRVVLLDREQRKAELARITGGSHVTEALLASAGELLDQAERYRSELGMRNHAE